LGALISLLYFTVGLKEFNPIQLTSASVIQLTKLLPKDHRLLEYLPLAWNPENIRTRQLIFMRDKVSEPLSLAEFWFFVQMILTGEFKSLPEGNYNELSLVRLMVDLLERRDLFAALKFSHEPRSQVDYGRALINITAPVAVFVGEKDQIAPPATSLPILEMVGSKTREAFIDPEAGHVDVWVGKRSMVSWEKSLAFFNAQY
jgi:pimeloyl-ACP methyl ester carboxylesterase